MPTLRRLLLTPTVAALAWAPLVAQQSALITGHVTDTYGAALGGAQVSLASLAISTTARGNGSYSLIVPAARIPSTPVMVTARAIGYKPDSTAVTLDAGSTTADFVLAQDPLHLGEVVVTGAGTSSELEKLGTVHNRIDSAAIGGANEQNLVSALAAKAPNVLVVSSSGDPGASSYIQVRGLTSISSSDGQPLFVVDGVPVGNTTDYSNPAQEGLNGSHIFPPNRLIDLNPSDIETIEILKGPSATAIYGSRGGQGIVLITTKHGRPDQTRYSLRSAWSLDQHTQLPALQRQFGSGSGGVSPNCVPGPDAPVPDPNHLNCFLGFDQAGSWGMAIPAGTPTYDHASDIFQDGYTTDNVLSASGGTEATQFFLSGEYSYDRGIVVGGNNHYRRVSVRSNGSQRITGRLTVSANIAHSNGSGGFVQSRNTTAGLLLGAWRTTPTFDNLPYLDPEFGLQRSFRFPNPGPGSERMSRGWNNPFFTANENPATSDVSRTFGGIDAEWAPAAWLKVHETLGLDYWNDERFEAWAQSTSEASVGAVFGTGGVNAGYIRRTQLDNNLTATLSYHASPRFTGTVIVGHNLNSQTGQSRQSLGIGLVAPHPFDLANTSTLAAPSYDFYQKIHLESYFGQVTADLWDRLHLSGAVRNDGVSSFGAGSQRHWFPQASAAWVFRHPSGETQGLFTYGKLRAAYGQSGTQPQPYLLSSVFTPSPIEIIGVGGFTTAPTLRNQTLAPERVKEFEAGVDLGLFGDKADLSVTHYRQNSQDVILVIPVALSSGYTQVAANAASLQNRGWEVSLNLRAMTSKSFAWDVAFQWARNRGITTSLAPGIDSFVPLPLNGGTNGAGVLTGVAQPGQPIAAYRGADFMRCGRGLISNEGVDIDHTAGYCQSTPAGALYIGPSGYPELDVNNTYILGDPNPDWTGSVRSSVRIGKLSLGGLLDIRRGGISSNGTKGALQHFGVAQITAETRNAAPVAFGPDYYPMKVDPTNPNHAVAGPGVGVKVPLDESWWTGEASIFNGPDAAFLEQGEFVKLREVSIGYTLDRPWVSHMLGFSSLELRVAGRNLISWNNYTGVDPETSLLGAASAVRGIDYFNSPQTRSWVLTLTLNR